MRDPANGSLIVELHRSTGMQYADSTDLWFYPVENWGDEIDVRVLWRPAAGAERVLVPKTRLVADRAQWPLSLPIAN